MEGGGTADRSVQGSDSHGAEAGKAGTRRGGAAAEGVRVAVRRPDAPWAQLPPG